MAATLSVTEPDEITRLLQEWTISRNEPADELWSLMYAELKQIGTACMRNERPDHTLQTTALVHEAYLRLFQQKPFRWENRKHLYCAMAQVMRRILVDHARASHADKRGGIRKPLPLDKALHMAATAPRDMLALDGALKELAMLNPRQSQVVELRFFAGLTVAETAVMLNVSPETVKLDWRFAKAWLQRHMRSAGGDELA